MSRIAAIATAALFLSLSVPGVPLARAVSRRQSGHPSLARPLEAGATVIHSIRNDVSAPLASLKDKGKGEGQGQEGAGPGHTG